MYLYDIHIYIYMYIANLLERARPADGTSMRTYADVR
jgi:hypothetical protein